MSTNAKLEKKENNEVTFVFEVGPEKFEEGLKHSYDKNKNRFNIPGFRKGKVPRKIVESQFGVEVLYDDAFNYILSESYEDAVKELGLDIVSKPSINVSEANKQKGVTFTVDVTVKPEVTLGQYKGLAYKGEPVAVTEEEIGQKLQELQEKNARVVTVTDRNSQMGDTVVIDFEGFIGDTPFEGGKGTDYELVLGSKSFIDTFEDQLVDKAVGDDVEVNVTFPEDYASEELKGKQAMFKVEIKDIKMRELPELDDDFAQDVSDFDTLEEYKNDIQSKILEEKELAEKNKKEEALINQAIENATMDVPDVMIENQIDQIVNDFGNRLRMQGLSVDMYLQYIGQSMEDMRKTYQQQAEEQVKARLLLEAVAKEETIEITEEELDQELDRIAESYNLERDKIGQLIGDSEFAGLKEDLKVQKALALIVENAIEE